MVDSAYKNIVEKVLNEGYLYDDPNREGVKRLEIPSYTFRHEFKDGFPAITLKELAFKSVTTELIWFLRGDTNIKYLVDNGCRIWNKDAYNYYKRICKKLNISPITMSAFIVDVKEGKKLRGINYTCGDLDKVYGHYWRNFDGVDQIKELIRDMINKPMSSELLVVARNPADKEEQALPCCHYGFQIVMRPLKYDFEELDGDGLVHFTKEYSKYAEDDQTELDYWNSYWYKHAHTLYPKYGFELHWKQRSCDLFLGIPFNIASYAELALILEKITGHKALAIQGDLKKVHLYDNSIEEAKELIKREPSNDKVILRFKGEENNQLLEKVGRGERTLDYWLSKTEPSRIVLHGYNPQPPMRVEMLSRT